MGKKLALMVIALSVAATAGFIGFGIWHSKVTTPTFQQDGYILQGDETGVKQLAFHSGEPYSATLNGAVRFKTAGGTEATVSRESFVHMGGDSVMALSDGVLLDFHDLSNNFINNYYMTAKLLVTRSGDSYLAETTAGTMEFGEHLWKLSDDKFIIQSPTLTVHFSSEDEREVSDYVQVMVSEDKVVYLLTPENLWMTISENCYIETAGGVKINPVSMIVEDGAFKLSIAKLSVSTDDAIVLTEDETRRQIVPELNIEAIDGEDGEAGIAGENGEIGENGTDGENGEDGQDGEDGTDGQAGGSGEAGANGSKGTTGKDGQSGSNGPAGTSGINGGKGATPDKAVDGSDGQVGGTGATGPNAEVESSTNSALPVMTIGEWDVTPTSVYGTIQITDESGMLLAMQSAGSSSNIEYAATVTITEVATGRKIHCYSDGETDPNEYLFLTEFYSGNSSVAFKTLTDAGEEYRLKPNMEYRLSVIAYYKTEDQTGLIYAREFINRTFYTDSTGVTLTPVSSTQDSVTVNVTLGEEYRSSISSATVYLLTPQQNETFSAEAAQGNANLYLRKCELRASDFSADENWTVPVLFQNTGAVGETELTSNRTYIARVYVETPGVKALTQQEIVVKTLKQLPEQGTGKPTAGYNRASGAFEVFRPLIQDPDGGAVRYIYTAEYKNDKGEWTEETSRTISASVGDPVEFHLQSNREYRFRVTMIFDDNEKEITYPLGESDPVTAVGDTLPRLSLTPNSAPSSQEYDKYNGTLYISLGKHSHLKIDPNHPLKLIFYADQLLSNTVELTQCNIGVPLDPKHPELGTVTLLTPPDSISGDMTVQVGLELNNLCKNSNYAITAEGAINLGASGDNSDLSSGPHSTQTLGTVSFRTLTPVTTAVKFESGTTTGRAFARKCTIALSAAGDTDGTRVTHAKEQLKNGRVTMALYSGTGLQKVLIDQKEIISPDLESLYSTGMEITDATFGRTLNKDGRYTLEVTAIADDTYNMGLGYVNTFDPGPGAADSITVDPTPPDLLSDPTKGITATPILNSQAVNYGEKKDLSLPDDAIVGYTLVSSYDNVQRIGQSITYYAYEFNDFYNTLAQDKDPIKNGRPLMTMTQAFGDSNTPPKVALFFGGTQDVGQLVNGWYVYHAGSASSTPVALQSGMDRGFRYIFAYTVVYKTSEASQEQTYPYDHPDYKQFLSAHGGLTLNGKTFKKNAAYMLTSPLCQAPKLMPDFHTYVDRSEAHGLEGNNPLQGTGSVTLHYSWRDSEPEKMIKTGMGSNGTAIYLGDTKVQQVDKTQEGETSDPQWYSVPLNYTINKGEDQLLEVSVDIKEYVLDYSAALTTFTYVNDPERYPVCSIPVDWNWEGQFGLNSYQDRININVMAESTMNSFIFELNGSSADVILGEIQQRGIALELHITDKDGGNERAFRYPLLKSSLHNIHARIPYGNFSDYAGGFKIKDAKLLYDTGVQGWSLAETHTGDRLALQYTNKVDTNSGSNKFGFSEYMNAVGDGTIPGSGALVSTKTFTLDDLHRTIAAQAALDSRLLLTISPGLQQGSGSRVQYLYPDQNGVESGNSNSVTQKSGRYLVPKKVGEYQLNFDRTQVYTLEDMTPTVNYKEFPATSSTIEVTGLEINGLPGDSGTVYMALYENAEAANGIVNAVKGPIEIQIENKVPKDPDALKFTGLDTARKYWIAFYYEKSGNYVLLLDDHDKSSSEVKPAIYTQTTSELPFIEVVNYQYDNNSYEDKTASFAFTITRVFGVTVEYSIHATQGDADNGVNALFTDADLRADKALFSCPDALSSGSYQNMLKLFLNPDMRRDALKPGRTYYLRIQAKEQESTEMGTCVYPFTIPSVGQYGAQIYTNFASGKEIKFEVTINDPQHTFMNDSYVVRFTKEVDGKEYRLYTNFDDEIYSINNMGSIKREFLLDNSALKFAGDTTYKYQSIDPEKTYRMYVYAAQDVDHHGQITYHDPEDAGKTLIIKFTDLISDMKAFFEGVLDKFWDTNTLEKKATKAVEAAERDFLVGSKTQMTTRDDGWLLNDDPKCFYATRQKTNTIRMTFEESFGLTDHGPNKGPVFRQIDWSVDGTTTGGMPVQQTGTCLFSDQDILIKEGTYAGKDIFYFDIPSEVGSGVYTITLQLRPDEGSNDGLESLSWKGSV